MGSTNAENVVCPSKDYRIKFEGHKPLPWPANESLEIDDLDADSTHKIIIYCGQRKFRTLDFKFSTYKTTQLALFLTGDGETHFFVTLYPACVQLEESTRR